MREREQATRTRVVAGRHKDATKERAMAGAGGGAMVRWALSLWIAGMCLPVAAAEPAAPVGGAKALRCPARLSVASTALRSPALPVGAQLELAADVLKLYSAGVYSGPPREEAVLMERNADSQRAADSGVSVWEFETPDPRGIYLACTYGPQGRVVLSQRVPDDVARCRSTTQRDAKAAAAGVAGVAFECE
jgi:hypothetical protein